MKYQKGVARKYKKIIDAAFAVIADIGTDQQKRVMNAIGESEMLICVGPLSEVRASGITGVTDPARANSRIAAERLSLPEALGEVFITFAAETIDGAGARGTEGTLVHEAQHAYDFGKVIESFSKTDINPLTVFDPTLYEMELAAHLTSGDFMVRRNLPEYLDEGLGLGLIERSGDGFAVSRTGILKRLRESYGLESGGNQGALASEMGGLVQR
jgi:hypothetical protein